MATITENLKTTVTNRIANKSVEYSIAKQDVSNTFDDTIDLLGAPIINPDLYYPLGWVGNYEGVYYVTLQDNVLGDVTVTVNWAKLVSGEKGLVSGVTTFETVAAHITEDYYIANSISINEETGKLLQYVITGVQTTTSLNLAYAIEVDLENAVDGDCVLLDMQTMGSGMNVLQIVIGEAFNGIEWLSNASTYLLTYQSQQTVDGKNYTLRKISETGFTRILNSTNALYVGTGKVLINSGNEHDIVLPSAFNLAGQSVEIIIQDGSVGSISVLEGDFIVGTPSNKIVSDGINTWIYV